MPEETRYQHAELPQQPAQAAQELIKRISSTAKASKTRMAATVKAHATNQALQVRTALEELAKINDTAYWSIRMLVELSGQAKRDDERAAPSQRDLAQHGGVSLASVHQWIHHPAQVSEDGRTGPGTIPKPGQASHYYKSPQYFADTHPESDDWDPRTRATREKDTTQ
jgi:pyruvate/2-oxoglutarate dehydrogenase complex dihydrolipoamide acyltransferase (E2) component